MVQIVEVSRYRVLGQEFDSLEKARQFIDEKLAEKICDGLCGAVVLAPGDKLKILNAITKLDVRDRRDYASLFDLDYEEE